jgi:prophage regulatory protein
MTSTPTRLLRLPAVIAMTGMGRDSIYRLAREGRFPKPRKLTERSSGWREDEILAWIESRPAYQPATASRPVAS